ncbi:MAG: hypothetical protein D6760_12365, partial [Deltaproteobacteria bacterium]
MNIRNVTAVILVILVSFGVGAGAGLLWHQWQGASQEAPTPAVEHEHEGAGAQGGAEEAKTWYTCGMHPEVIQDHPGDCPKCGMKLQPMAPDRAAAMGLTAAPAGGSKPKG